MLTRILSLVSACLLGVAPSINAQLQDRGAAETVRVTVSVNEDGSRTSYQFDPANRKAEATTTSAAGKRLSKIRYNLDDAGRFAAGEVYDAKNRLRFKTQYKYNAVGQLVQETQLTKDDAVHHKIVYAYDQNGKQTGYSVFDPAGKLLGQTTPASSAPSLTKKKVR